jgi:zinc finger RNA-binding protein
MSRGPDSMEDRFVMGKHAEIYPEEEELTAISDLVANVERSLKQVSDVLADEDALKDETKK